MSGEESACTGSPYLPHWRPGQGIMSGVEPCPRHFSHERERDAAIAERLGVLLEAAAAANEGLGGRRHWAVAIRWRTQGARRDLPGTPRRADALQPLWRLVSEGGLEPPRPEGH
jgi:hypothetical protein